MRNLFKGLALAAALWSFAPATAAAFPDADKPITIIVPFSPGGTTDVSARTLAEFLEPELGVSFEVVNRPGATTQIGSTALSQAEPDGHTLSLASLPSSVNFLSALHTFVDSKPSNESFCVAHAASINAESRSSSALIKMAFMPGLMRSK